MREVQASARAVRGRPPVWWGPFAACRTASVESVELLIELTLNEFYRSGYEAMPHWAGRAVADAEVVGDAALRAAALAMPALAAAMTGPTDVARSRCAEAAAFVDELSDDELSLRPDAASWLAAAELYLDRYAEEVTRTRSRALGLARATGRGDPLFLCPILPRIWYVHRKLAEAAETLDGAIEAGRLLGSPPALAGNLFNRSVVAVAMGDVELALATSEEGVELTRDLDHGFRSGVGRRKAGRRPARSLETSQRRGVASQPRRWAGVDAHPRRLEGVLPRAAHRVLAGTRSPGRGRARSLCCRNDCGGRGLPLASAWADRAAAAVALHAGTPLPPSNALPLRLMRLEGRSPHRVRAVADARGPSASPGGPERPRRGGASARRSSIRRLRCAALPRSRGAELGKLGHRPHRRTRAGKLDGRGIDSLTERQIQITRLVVDRRTNSEIAAELFLSEKTVEAHLRNIFLKIGVPTRVELARFVMRADADAHASSA